SDFWMTHKTSSDATHAAAVGVLAGTDVECGYNYAYKSIPEAVRLGLMKEEDVNQKVIRLLEARFSLGEFDPAEMVEWKQIPMDKVAGKEHKALSLDMARQTITLLQNKNNILPLSKKIKKIAVIGPNADIETMMWGNYNGTPTQTISFLEGIKEKVNKRAITYLQGCDYTNMQTLHSMYNQCKADGKVGMKATFWNNTKREGEPVNVIWENAPFSKTTFGNYAFAPGVNLEGFSAIYDTYFTPSESGKVLLDMTSCGNYELRVDGKTMVKRETWLTLNERSFIEVEKGKTYHIEILYTQVPTYNTNLKFDLGFEKAFNYDDVINQLKGIDVVLFAGGISARYEGEEMPIEIEGFKGGDRTSIEFPAIQRSLIQKLKEAGKKVILVNFSGSAMALQPEAENCEAIVQAWYPGEMGGRAVADVLFGDYNPGGKLPVTFYKSDSQLPAYSDYSMKGRTYRYFNDALFPFGYGLSYTTFSVGEAAIAKKANGYVDVTIPIKNIGSRTGSEVLQIYVKALKDVNGPSKSLRAFKRVELKPGKGMDVTFQLEPEAFSFFDEKSNTMICADTEDVEYTLYYGTSSREEDLKSLPIVIAGK
ncbi:MAG: glycoside hydrolase family 3 C-terminal domain-containing protein, partial [Bacteroidales bacterium]|nr:glycoside hydrolase family 3 C-terminal domain-containing protein [Bacteroidales bacterium]